jgi:hypothetical protein
MERKDDTNIYISIFLPDFLKNNSLSLLFVFFGFLRALAGNCVARFVSSSLSHLPGSSNPGKMVR